MSDGEKTILKPECEFFEPVYVVTLSPGHVRYMTPVEFFNSDVENVIAEIRLLTPAPTIRSPNRVLRQSTYQGGDNCSFQTYDRLVEGESWEVRLRVHHAVGQMWLNDGMPCHSYSSFHSYLSLGKLFAFAECLDAWVRGTERNDDLANSYRGSPEHLVLDDVPYHGWCVLVFKRTNFVTEKLLAKQKMAEEQKENEDLGTLNKSRFDSFVYIMEDLRNGNFKIGRSKTPSKRERTLQSEAPTVALRFCIPADEDHEKQLHARFDSKRVRDEWFCVTADDLLWIVSFLKQHGDTARLSVDYEWLGKILIQARGA